MEKLRRKSKNFLILGILFLLPVYLVKIKFGWVSFNVLEFLIAALFLVWLFGRQKKYPAAAGPRQGGGQILNTRYWLAIGLIFLGVISSIIANQNYRTGLGALKGWFVAPVVFAIVLYEALKDDESLLRKSLIVLFFSGVTVAAVGIVYKFLGIVTYDGRLAAFWDSPNQLAMFLAMPFLIGLSFLIQGYRSRDPLRRSLTIGLLLIGLNLFFTFSYGAWVGILVAFGAVFWLKNKQAISRKHLAILFLLIAILLAAGISKYDSFKSLGERSSLASRLAIWKSGALMIENSPLFGIGPGNFQQKYLEYQKYFPPYLEWSAPQPHNIFLAFYLESGLVGIAGFFLLLFLFFRDNKIAMSKNRDLGILFCGVMLYVLVHGLVDATYWRNDLAVVFWVVIVANFFLAVGKREHEPWIQGA